MVKKKEEEKKSWADPAGNSKSEHRETMPSPPWAESKPKGTECTKGIKE